MAPIFTPADGQSIMPPSNNIPAAVRTIIATRAVPDISNESNHPRTKVILVIVFTIFGFAFMFAIIMRIVERAMSGTEPPRMPLGHVYGHNEAGSHELTRLRSRRERPNRQQAEDRASNGPESTGQNVVARPTPVVTRHSDRQEGSPSPPPCKQL